MIRQFLNSIAALVIMYSILSFEAELLVGAFVLFIYTIDFKTPFWQESPPRQQPEPYVDTIFDKGTRVHYDKGVEKYEKHQESKTLKEKIKADNEEISYD